MLTTPRAPWFVAAALLLAGVATCERVRRPRPLDQALLAWLPAKAETLFWLTPKAFEAPPGSPLGQQVAQLEAAVETASTVQLRRDVEQVVGVERLWVAKGRFTWPRVRAALERARFRVETFRDRELAVRDDGLCVTWDSGNLLAGPVDEVRAALHRKDTWPTAASTFAPLVAALQHPALLAGARGAGRVDPESVLGGDLARGLALGVIALSLGARGEAWRFEAAVFPSEPSRLAALDDALRGLITELRRDYPGRPGAEPVVVEVLGSLTQSDHGGAVLLGATAQGKTLARLAGLEGLTGPGPLGGSARAPRPTPELRAPSPGAVFAPREQIAHQWAPLPGVERYLLDFATPSPEGRCSFDAPREVVGSQLSLAHDDPHPCLVWRLRAAVSGQRGSPAGAPYTVGGPPGCALPPDALARCLESGLAAGP